MSNLIHIIYVSQSDMAWDDSKIKEILSAARQSNSQLDITGMLLFDGGSFFQVLEGDKVAVRKLYEKIKRDKRHQKLVKVIEEPIESRSFSDWTMGYSALSKEEIARAEGMNDFFKGDNCLVDLDEGRAQKLLEAFKQGRWRIK
ncbi:BLUF domain-containing protein [Pontibacter sp. JAM-7]|uniref:BLUF domain-containing protein n=1 Tax=Pontibacter sp. JAM-7 TaxID=3366581 RepID=UPI003AF4E746